MKRPSLVTPAERQPVTSQDILVAVSAATLWAVIAFTALAALLGA